MNDIDTLMSRVQEINAKSPFDLDATDIATLTALIAAHRASRARRAAGEKVPKTALEAPKPKLDLAALLKLPSPATVSLPTAPTPPSTSTKPLRR